MDKLYKFGAWLWRIKERVLLLILLVVLGARVYRIVNPPVPNTIFTPPKPPNSTASIPAGQVSNPPPLPAVPQRAEVQVNPFTTAGTRARREEGGEERPQFLLMAIREWRDGSYRAQLYLPTGRSSYFERGEELQPGYRLDSIDAEGQSVMIYSQQDGRRYEYRLGGAG